MEDDDVAPLDWPNFQLLDHDTCQHVVGQIWKLWIATCHDL